VATTANKKTRAARAELQAWYLRGLLPKLVQAARIGVVDVGAVDALDADVRALLEISQERRGAA
jgi:hypothetical protein